MVSVGAAFYKQVTPYGGYKRQAYRTMLVYCLLTLPGVQCEPHEPTVSACLDEFQNGGGECEWFISGALLGADAIFSAFRGSL
jgi:hypothetical protein